MTDSWAIRVAVGEAAGQGHLSRAKLLLPILKQHASVAYYENHDDPDTKNFYSGCLIDAYDMHADELARWRDRAKTLVQISDDGRHYPSVDFVICPTAVNAMRFGKKSLYSGLKYAVVNPQFFFSREHVLKVAKKILVAFGCVDSHNATLKTIRALQILMGQGEVLEVGVFIASKAKYFSLLMEEEKFLPTGFHYYIDSEEMPSYMREADLAIGAGGVSALERVANRLPSITLSTAEQQNAMIDYLSDQTAIHSLGDIRSVSIERLANTIHSLMYHQKKRDTMRISTIDLLDQKGPERIVDLLMENR